MNYREQYVLPRASPLHVTASAWAAANPFSTLEMPPSRSSLPGSLGLSDARGKTTPAASSKRLWGLGHRSFDYFYISY